METGKLKRGIKLLPILFLTISLAGLDTQNKDQSAIEFLSLFPEISFDTLHVYSPCDKPDGNKFQGKIIDSTFHKFFPLDEWRLYNLRWQNIYSCYKFEISDSLTGLIARMPSQYSETAVDLFIWDSNAQKVIESVELSDGFADGMWYFVRDSWLLDLNEDQTIDIVTRRKSWSQEDVDPTPDNPLGLGAEHLSDTVMIFTANQGSYQIADLEIDIDKFRLLNWSRD